MRDPYMEGYEAALAGNWVNPYCETMESAMYAEWEEGYMQGEIDAEDEAEGQS